MNDNKNLLILGAGGHGQVVKETAEAMGVFDRIEFLDDNPDCDISLGKCADFENYISEFRYMFPAFGNNELRMKWVERLEEAVVIVPVIVHPRAFISPSSSVYPGSIVEACAIVNTNSYIEKGCIVSVGAIVDHDSFIGYGCHVSCGAIVKAGCIVRAMTMVLSGMVVTRDDNPTASELIG
jgi:hypothetical protein